VQIWVPQPGLAPGAQTHSPGWGCAAPYPPQPERSRLTNALFSSAAYFQQKITEYQEQKKHRRDS